MHPFHQDLASVNDISIEPRVGVLA